MNLINTLESLSEKTLNELAITKSMFTLKGSEKFIESLCFNLDYVM